jgi:hypothetical protein
MPHNNALLLLENLTAAEREAFQHYAASRKYGGRPDLEKLLPVMCKYLNDIEKNKKTGKAENETTNDFLKRKAFSDKKANDKTSDQAENETTNDFSKQKALPDKKANDKTSDQSENETTNDLSKQKAFVNKKPSDKTFDQYIFALSNLLKEYFVVQRVINDKLLQQRFLLEDLRKRNLIDFIEKKDNKITKVANENLAESTDLYTIRWQIEDHTDRYQEVLLYQKQTAHNNIINASAAADALFLVNKLRYMCIANNHNTVASTAEKITLVGTDIVLKWIKDCPVYLEKYPLLNAYYLLWQMLQDREETDLFDKALNFIIPNESRFDALELDTIYSLLTNYTSAKINAGETDFIKITMDLYQDGLAKGYFHCDNMTIISIYKNIVKLSIRCGRTEETREWLAVLKTHKKQFSDNIHTYCAACLDFHNGNYQIVIVSIKDLSFSDESDKIDNHILLLRAYFCANTADEFQMQAVVTRTALSRAKDKISKEHYNQYKKFVHILVKIKAHNDLLYYKKMSAQTQANNRQNIVKIINDTTQIIYKAWLSAQVK